MKKILIIDDEGDIRQLISDILEDEGYTTLQACDSHAALDTLDGSAPDLIVLDIWLEGSELDGLALLKEIKERSPLIPVIMISGHGTIETAVHALKDGAYDFIEKPFKTDRLLILVRRALESAQLLQENINLKSLNNSIKLSCFGETVAYQKYIQTLKRAAKAQSRVVLSGEAGTGKTAAARYIHDNSSRAHMPFITVNCAALNPDRFEVELFGAEKGASGLGYSVSGLLHDADGGTLLLDEVADMPPILQAKLLKVLQGNSFQRLGSEDIIDLDVRIIATTQKDLKLESDQRNFREDLYYRLNVLPINVPSLRDYAGDISLFSKHFTQTISKANNLAQDITFDTKTIDVMKRYNWPGNIRELRNVIEWVLIFHQDIENILPEHLPANMASGNGLDSEGGTNNSIESYLSFGLKAARTQFESAYLQAQLDKADGNVSKTAENVGMERSALHRKIKQLMLSVNKGNV